MNRKGTLMVAAIAAAGAALALPASDQQLLDAVALQQTRALALDTALVRDGQATAMIVAPVTAPWAEIGRASCRERV